MDLKCSNIMIGLLVAISFLTNACSFKSITGSGNIIEEHRPVSGFQKVTVSGSGHLSIHQGNKESLEIECDDNIAPYIRAEVENGILKIGPGNVKLNPSRQIAYNLSLKNINVLKTSGAVIVKGDTLRTERLSVVITGSGKFSLKNIETQSIAIDISGSGNINIESGNSKKQKLKISGSGELNAPNLKSEDIDLSISGSGKAEVWVTDALDVKISGSGKLYYYGSPMISAKITGSGKVESLGKK